MRNTIIFLFLAFLLAYSCKKDDNSVLALTNQIACCNVDDPINELSWLNELVNDTDYPVMSVWVKEFEGNNIIVISFALSSMMYHPYNCLGNPITIENTDFYNSLTDTDLIYYWLSYDLGGSD